MGWHANYVAEFEIGSGEPTKEEEAEILAEFTKLLNECAVGKPLGKTGHTVKKLKSMNLHRIPH